MRVLFASDTHVHPGHLDRLLRLADRLHPDLVIIGGDLIPAWRKSIQESIQPHCQWVRERLLPRLESFRRTHPETPVFADLGNDDIAAALPLLEDRDGHDLHLMHMKVRRLGPDLAIVGYMNVNPTPFRIKDRERPDCRDENGLNQPGVCRVGSITRGGVESSVVLDPSNGTIEDDLAALSNRLSASEWNAMRFLFVSHCPPRNTALDCTSHGDHVGSLAVRRFIERWAGTGRLIASLHGHIHESPMETGSFMERFGSVPAFNVGQQQRVLRALSFDTENPVGTAELLLDPGSHIPPVVR
jgi:Icc-related predicted phosphoesterase